MDVEKIATSAVINSISKTDVLSPYINEGDKEPSWDGNIYIHKDSKKTKEDIKRVPVQVKGTTKRYRAKSTIKYTVSVEDLRNYLNNGGTLFFVVTMDADGDNTRIYYNSLLPVKLRFLLKGVNDQSTKSIEFKEFPKKKEIKEAVLKNCFNDMIKQISYANADLQSIVELEKNELLESFSLSCFPFESNKGIDALIYQDDLYVYAKLKGSSALQPVDSLVKSITKEIEVNEKVSVCGEIHYSSFKHIKSREEDEYLIGKSCKLIMSEKNKTVKTEIRITDIILDAVKDLKFILDVYNHQEMVIGENSIPMERNIVFADFNEGVYLKALKSFEKLIQLLNLLKLPTNISIKDFSKQDMKAAEVLIKGLVDKQDVSIIEELPATCIKYDFLGKKIALWFEKNNDGTYRVYDYFRAPFVLFFTDENDRQLQTSKYDLLKACDFIEIHNLYFDELISSYTGIEGDYLRSRLNNCMLELLKAYDESKGKRTDILNQAKEIAAFLNSDPISKEEICQEIRDINKLQIKKREGLLSKSDKLLLFQIAENINVGNDLRTAAYILLDDDIHAEQCFQKLSIEEQNSFKEFPIFYLWGNNEVGIG